MKIFPFPTVSMPLEFLGSCLCLGFYLNSNSQWSLVKQMFLYPMLVNTLYPRFNFFYFIFWCLGLFMVMMLWHKARHGLMTSLFSIPLAVVSVRSVCCSCYRYIIGCLAVIWLSVVKWWQCSVVGSQVPFLSDCSRRDVAICWWTLCFLSSSLLCGCFSMIDFLVAMLHMKKFSCYRYFIVYMALKKSLGARLRQPLDPL